MSIEAWIDRYKHMKGIAMGKATDVNAGRSCKGCW